MSRSAIGEQPFPAFFAWALTIYVAVVVGRIHEAVPFIARLYVGKLSAVVLLVATFSQIRGDVFKAFMKTTPARAYIAITVLGVLSVPVSFWPSQSLSFLENTWPQALLMFVCVAVGFTNRRTGLLCVTGLVLSCAIGVIQILRGGGPDIGGRLYVGNGLSQTYDPNQSAAFFITVLPYVVLLAARKGPLRWIALPLVPAFVIALLKTGSRGGVVALGVLALTFLAVATKKQRKAGLILFPIILITLFLTPHSGLVERFNELLGSGTDYNLTARDGRWQVWSRGMGLLITHPVLGVGIGAYDIANSVVSGSWKNAHNAYVQIAVELGIGGILAFLFAIRHAFRAGWTVRKLTAAAAASGPDPDGNIALDRLFATTAICSLVGELTSAIFLSMAYDAMTLFVIAVPTALLLAKGGAMPTAGKPTKAQPANAPAPSAPYRGPGWRSARRFVTRPAARSRV
jgi:O-antigen ligase